MLKSLKQKSHGKKTNLKEAGPAPATLAKRKSVVIIWSSTLKKHSIFINLRKSLFFLGYNHGSTLIPFSSNLKKCCPSGHARPYKKAVPQSPKTIKNTPPKKKDRFPKKKTFSFEGSSFVSRRWPQNRSHFEAFWQICETNVQAGSISYMRSVLSTDMQTLKFSA